MITVDVLQVGDIKTNCYIIANDVTKEAIIIDPGDEEERILAALKEKELKGVGIYLTHGHFDHILAAKTVAKQIGVKIYCSEMEAALVNSEDANLSAMFGWPYALKPDETLTDGQIVTILGTKMQVFLTPGHTQGSVCYYFAAEGLLFSGDTIFYESYGRTDFPGGSEAAIRMSVTGILNALPEDVIVYPGHDCPTTILNERLHNPAMSGM